VGKNILGTSLEQISEVNTHPSLSVGLLYQHNICQRIRVLNLPYVASMKELLSFLSDDEAFVFIEFSSPLNHGFDLFIRGKQMA